MSIFTSFNNPRPEKVVRATAEDMAYNMVMEAIEGIKARRKEAEEAENRCEPSLPQTQEDKERYEVLEAMLKGRHRHIAVHCLLEHFPEFITDQKQAQS